MKRTINIDKINVIVKNIKNNIEIYETKKNKILTDIESISIYYDGNKKDQIIFNYKNIINNLNIVIENINMYISYLEKILSSYQDVYENSLKDMNIDSNEFIVNY